MLDDAIKWMPYGFDDESVIDHVVWTGYPSWTSGDTDRIRCLRCGDGALLTTPNPWRRIELMDDFARDHLHGQPPRLLDE